MTQEKYIYYIYIIQREKCVNIFNFERAQQKKKWKINRAKHIRKGIMDPKKERQMASKHKKFSFLHWHTNLVYQI